MYTDSARIRKELKGYIVLHQVVAAPMIGAAAYAIVFNFWVTAVFTLGFGWANLAWSYKLQDLYDKV